MYDTKKPLPVTAIILAGGDSTRMESPKAFAEVGGVCIIEREMTALSPVFDEVIIVSGDPEGYGCFGARTVKDSGAFGDVRGPMVGVCSGLLAASNDYAFVVGCDMPFIQPGLAAWIAGMREGFDLVIPRVNGYAEPLFGVYKKTAAKAMEKALAAGKRRLRDVFGRLDVRYVEEDELRRIDPGLFSFVNVNTPAQLEKARAIAKVLSGGTDRFPADDGGRRALVRQGGAAG